MTQPAEPVQGQPEEVVTDPPQQPQENKAPYADYLEKLPETIRPLVEPVFKDWDAGVTQRFQELHSQQEPWKPVLDQYQPDDVLGALQVSQILEQDPVRFLTAFAEAYPDLVKEALGQGGPEATNTPTPASEQGLGDLDPDDPVAKQLKAMQDQLAQLTGNLTERQEQELMQQQQQELDQILAGLHEQHGDFDDTFILAQMAYANRTPEQAMQAWNEAKSKFGGTASNAQTQTPAPSPIPSNGGIPSTQFNAEDLQDGDVKNLVAQLLEQANTQT